MASRNLVVQLVLRAKDAASGVFDRFGRGLTGIKNTLVSLPGLVTAAFGGFAIGQFFSSATQSAASFEQQMATVAAVTKASAEDLNALKAAAEDAGATTKFTATQAAEGLENLARAGLNAQQSIKALPSVLSLATAENLDLAESASFITESLAQFGLDIDQAGRVIDVLVKTSQSANTNVREVGNALSYAALLAKDAGISLEETSALIGKLADNGIKGERAGTALRAILSQLADPASKARKELAELGDTSGDLSTALDTIRDAGDQGRDALLAFGTEAAPALRALVNTGKPALDQLTESLENAAGTSSQAAATMGATLTGATTRLASAWDSLKRTLVQPLLGLIAGEADRLAKSIGEFVTSGRLGQLQMALVEAFTTSAAAAREFFSNFDFDKFIADLSSFAKSTVEAFGTITKVAGVAADVMTLAFNGLKSVIAAARIAKNQITGDVDQVDNAFNRAEQTRDALVEGGREGSEEYRKLDAQIQSLRDNLQIIDQFGRSPRNFAADFSFGMGELLRNAERAKAVLGEVDRIMATLGDETARAGELTLALARANGIARNEAELLGEQRLDQLRRSIADAERRMSDFADQVAQARRELEALDAREARARGDEEGARLREQELQFAEEIEELEARIAEARRLGLFELVNLLEQQRQRLLDIQRIERQRLEDEEKARRRREREAAKPAESAGASSGASTGSGTRPLGQDIQAGRDYLGVLDQIDEREARLSRNREDRLEREAQVARRITGGTRDRLGQLQYSDDDIRAIATGLERLAGLRA